MRLADGLELRSARAEDIEQVGALLAARGDAADAVDLALVVGDPDEGLASCAVVVDGDRVVSTATLLAEELDLGGVRLPAGQVELVATDPAYEGRGLVRALMQWAHDRCAARGDLVQVMIGIPYFYRQFGYVYSTPMHPWRTANGPVGGERRAAGGDRAAVTTVRRATAGDIASMRALQHQAQTVADLRMPHSQACWRWLLARDGSDTWVAARGEEIVATARSTPPAEGLAIAEVAAVDEAAAIDLVSGIVDTVAPGSSPVVQDRVGTVASRGLDATLAPPEDAPDWYYLRVPRFGALLEALGPLLTRRAEAAGLLDMPREVLISSFRSHVRFTLGPNGMGPVREGGPLQAPGSVGGCGVPPDAVAPLLFGPYGAAGLAERLPDCYLAELAEVMPVLFPPVRADLLTFFLPA